MRKTPARRPAATRRSIRLRTYIASVMLLYVGAFAAMLVVGGPPVTGLLETTVALLGGSLAIAWLGTIRMMQISPTTSASPYLLPSFLHGAVLSIMLIATVFAP